MSVIPGGCTKFLQHVDLSLNKPVKDHYRYFYDECLRIGPFEYTRGGNLKTPSFRTQIEWLLTAWRKIPSEVVRRSFDACGITQCDSSSIHCLKPDAQLFQLQLCC